MNIKIVFLFYFFKINIWNILNKIIRLVLINDKILCNLKFLFLIKVFLKVLVKILKNNIIKNIFVDIDKVNKNKFLLSLKFFKNKSIVIILG